jgi:two-component system, NarL family, response regulator NreC
MDKAVANPNVIALMTTLILADDHHLVRKALKILLQAEAGFKVIGEASNGAEAIEMVRKKKPDILLLDLAMPRVHGLDVIRQITDGMRTKVIVVSMLSAEPYVVEALKCGARGYILKESMPDDLAEGIRQVSAGKTYLSETLPHKEILSMGNFVHG